MKKGLHNSSTLWMLLFYTALFVVLVVTKNTQFWKMSTASSDLVQMVSKSAKSHSLLLALRDAEMNEQYAVLNLVYATGDDQTQATHNLYHQQALTDTLLQHIVLLPQTSKEQKLFTNLQQLSKSKSAILDSVVLLNTEKKNATEVMGYVDKFNKLFGSIHSNNKELSDAIHGRYTRQIHKTQQRIVTLGDINLWISGVLIIVMLLLGISLVKLGKQSRRTTLELKESERKYRKLTEQTNEIIEKCDAKGNFVFVNDSFRKTFEYSGTDISKLSFSDISEKGHRDLIEYPATGDEVITQVKEVFKTKSGKRIYLEGNIVAEYKNGKFTGTMGFFNDVTEKKQLEESLVSSELKFRTFFNVAPIPMWAVDPENYQFVLVNKAALAHYGFNEQEFLNKTIMDLRLDDEFSKIEADVSQIRMDIFKGNQNKVYRYNVNHFKKTGEKIDVEIYTSPITLEGRKCVLTIAIDVTERNQYENKITRAIIKTQEDERYEIGSELHDNVCQILAATGINLSRLKPSLSAPDLGLHLQATEGIRLATDEIRNLSHRLAPAFFENTKLEDAFEGLLKSFNIHDSYKVSMCFDPALTNYPLSTEVQLNMYRILQEQIRNIIKYAQCTRIQIQVRMNDHKLSMRIADDGIGFALDGAKGGIGLANMKRRAELFGGEFYINSSPGNGCELLITIPV